MTDKPKPNPSCDEACMFICSSEAKQAITAEREVSDKLEKALKFALGHIDPKSVDMAKWSSGKQPWHVNSIISATISEVETIRSTHTNREQAD